MSKPDVLIAGAGPTGLVMALWLTKQGIPVRIVDKAAKAGTTSRALVVHAKNLEFYHQLGIDKVITDNGLIFKAANLWFRDKKVGHVPFGDIGKDISPYPYALMLPQDKHEELLIAELDKLGVTIERNTSLLSFEQSADGITAVLQKQDGGQEVCEAKYLAGCDGAHSVVREQLGVGFPGGTYEQIFYVADIEAAGKFADGELHIALDTSDFLAIFPMNGDGRIRLVGAVKPEAKGKQEMQWDDVSKDVLHRLHIEIKKLNWFSTYKVHHRVASHFRKGNVFILGDAAHIHSPVGGQGMNTGIGDAVNLAWKMAAVIKHNASPAILDSFEPERITFAKQLVATTDRAFTAVEQNGFLARFVRTKLIPAIVPFASRFDAVRREMFKVLSQTQIEYRHSPLSEGGDGKLKAGDRLPWIKQDWMPGSNGDNYETLKTRNWQLHYYGAANDTVQEISDQYNIPLNSFTWSDAVSETGIKQDDLYLVRPDGYIGLVVSDGDVQKIKAYLDHWQIKI